MIDLNSPGYEFQGMSLSGGGMTANLSLQAIWIRDLCRELDRKYSSGNAPTGVGTCTHHLLSAARRRELGMGRSLEHRNGSNKRQLLRECRPASLPRTRSQPQHSRGKYTIPVGSLGAPSMFIELSNVNSTALCYRRPAGSGLGSVSGSFDRLPRCRHASIRLSPSPAVQMSRPFP